MRAELFPAGKVITFEDLNDLAAFEDVVAPLIDPYYHAAAWSRRLPLRNLLRPAGFHGRMYDATLEVMDQPYQKLRSAKARGWKGATGGRERYKDDYLGFCF